MGTSLPVILALRRSYLRISSGFVRGKDHPETHVLSVSNDNEVFLNLRAVFELDHACFVIDVDDLGAEPDDRAGCLGQFSEMSVHVNSMIKIPLVSVLLFNIGKRQRGRHWL